MPVNMPLSDSLKPSRINGVVMAWQDGSLLIRRPGEQQAELLNPEAAFIWQLCDGEHTVLDITGVLKDSGAPPDTLTNMVSESVREMFYRKLVDLKPMQVHPLIRLTLTGFPEEFNVRDNVIVNSLLNRFDVLVVDDTEQADIEVVLQPPVGNLRDKVAALRFLVAYESIAPSHEADLLMLIGPVDVSASVPHLLLPSDCLINNNALLGHEARLQLDEFFAIDNDRNKAGTDSERGTHNLPPRLTIGMATYDDYDGVYFSVQAVHMYHPEVLEEIEFLVIDNHPGGPCSSDLKALGDWLPNYRCIPNDKIRGTAIRDFVVREARTEFVLTMDCHVFIVPGALRRLLDYFYSNPDSSDLLQGPLLYDDLKTISTHFEPAWREGMFGTWATDERGVDPDAEPFDIPMQGMGLSACRRDAWPGYNHRLNGFGAEEGYVHQKLRNRGSRTLCLPFLRWMHRFARPMGVHYENIWEDRIRNYMITFEEVGLDTKSVIQHFNGLVGALIVERVRQHLQLEKENPFDNFDVIYCINQHVSSERWSRMCDRFWQLGIFFRARHFPAIESQVSDAVNSVLSHRAVVAEAAAQGYRNVLVFEDDATFSDDVLSRMRKAIDHLATMSWQVFSFSDSEDSEVKEVQTLPEQDIKPAEPGVALGTRAIVYDSSLYESILNDIPAEVIPMADWILENGGLGTYLSRKRAYLLTSAAVVGE